jgi:hypothetical protein
MGLLDNCSYVMHKALVAVLLVVMFGVFVAM